MADKTGKLYEFFAEFIAQTAFDNKANLLKYHVGARNTPTPKCISDSGICKHSADCRQINLPIGPWYDPDIMIYADSNPEACIHVTHWNNQGNSTYKFWRTLEEHLQYKLNLGNSFKSINFVFEAGQQSTNPLVFYPDSNPIPMRGWAPAVGKSLLIAFDASIVFPYKFKPLIMVQDIAKKNNIKMGNKNGLTLIMKDLYNNSSEFSDLIDDAVEKFAIAFIESRPLLNERSLIKMREVCFNGRNIANSYSMKQTTLRVRRGVQFLYILKNINPNTKKIDFDSLISSLSKLGDRFRLTDLKRHLYIDDEILKSITNIVVQMEDREPVFLLREAAGIELYSWHEDLLIFLENFRDLDQESKGKLNHYIDEIYLSYDENDDAAQAIEELRDYSRSKRIIDYVFLIINSVENTNKLKSVLLGEVKQINQSTPSAAEYDSKDNWLIKAVCDIFDIGLREKVVNVAAEIFKNRHGDDLSMYAFNGNSADLINKLMQNKDISENIRSSAKFSESELNKLIWPILIEVICSEVDSSKAISADKALMQYRYKRAMRIIAQSDLDPIARILSMATSSNRKPVAIKGIFNQIAKRRKWSNSAFTTLATRSDDGAKYIQTQSVVGGKNIDHKVKELAARRRSLGLMISEDGNIIPNDIEETHILIVDGDWPLRSKINLLESGFAEIIDIIDFTKLKKL
ncbi:hypothetical protein [Deinococcus knuensis]|uniref:Uncharacterized protein n=1 Tax=Deinococcus knuensis TaxID=1837380 RepID=A0ABQ2STH9_9DEIO|nr:hypothetical protein [Deinococcus knuensis]GGS37589.1 hypothetical protein GCM10008961_31440 [Deinococcus knuensis]